MAQFHTLTVKDIIRETDDAVSLVFDIPNNLKDVFKYVQGQYLTFKKDFNGEDVRRSYSLCSSPVTDAELKVAVKEVEGGKFSTFVNRELKQGDQLQVMAPMGNFFVALDADSNRHHVAFAAGSGITPVLSILKTTLEVEKNSRFTLIYGNRNPASVIFSKEIEQLKENYGERLTVHFIYSQNGADSELNRGRINAEKCGELLNITADLPRADEYFLCGPQEMIEAVKDWLIQNGVNKKSVHFELFTAAIPSTNGEAKSSNDDVNVTSQVTVVVDGEEYEFQLSTDGNAVLDAALDAGADVPFACKGAVCCTCRARVMEGSVKMAMNYALDDDELEEGFVLTCQSHPTSEKVVIDYDEQ